MTPESVMSLGFQATKVGLMIATPLLLAALAAGLLVSILQASTQINEMTLSFIPKILTLVVVLIACGPWMLTTLVDYMRGLFTSLPYLIR
ncbi:MULTISPECIES: flagellar biosynthesis protein FliQ [Kosakonia]|uniref:Flagellar biosynthetic protein FliQ n=1 Tax=Kosakonia cowanii JCM 10956 = DSM 18146 TaxID=1300165 RepID=A0A807LAX6_9ENTR|nr:MULTISPECIES: flagellar biosynthesis protein FliQ [Kosakonia]MDT3413390.1 flagellar biosynthetic protein FliQ [Atlantibacter sp. SORGH_AS_0304]APZ04397.1 flagellar export apparatus protein FliQ [Kosakonia cowanii JCM 10956 = DSM 18146]AST70518.1 flagellar biosynthetic protein FliQ [Kosakonia cowanii]AZI86475.1 flagellar biosynthetic protein FliQ [Kosakonia sp. CCTCC M2018092]MBK0017821.1 flagellar biosynthesis protein FliQ [Kosakonia sp. S42]